MDQAVFSALCNSVEGGVTDAASDELRALRLMTGRSTSSYIPKVLFPNFIFHAKDPTHASTRFLKVWLCDSYLKFTFELFIDGPNGIAKLISDSEDLTRRFGLRVSAAVDDEVQGASIKSMAYCKPRYNSSSQPLARQVLFIDATCGFSLEIVTVRAGDRPAAVCNYFMDHLDEEDMCPMGK